MPKSKVEILYLELCRTGESGCFEDGTQGTPYTKQLVSPTIEWIPTESVEAFLDEEGITRNREIRHIRNSSTLYPEEQKIRGFKPNRMNDKIIIENNFASIPREGATTITFDYLTKSVFFLDNPLRPKNLPALYKKIKVDERAVELLDEDELLTKAKSKVYSLRLNTGVGLKDYKYDEEKINSYCSLLNITDETPERRLVLLIDKATRNPRAFLELVVKAENTITTDVSHALHYNVIMFEGNTAQYTEESKLITVLGSGKMSEAKKVEILSNYLQTNEGTNALTEIRAKTELAKEKEFQK